jgi:replicative DNA helicase
MLEIRLREVQQKVSQGDLAGAESDLAKALKESKSSRGVKLPEPYLLDDLISDLKRTPPALSSGYTWLDKIAKIPAGALTIIAGRPGQGKTTFQLNLLVNMLRLYPDKHFYFFSYEEARKAISTKIIMILAGVEIQRETNYGAYIHYLKEKRGSDSRIDKAVQEYEGFTSSGRLLISDDMYRVEDLSSAIELLSKERQTGAVFIDYIQKIPIPAQSQRYLDIKLVSEIMLKQAVSLDIPIILGAQIKRGSTAGEPSLADLREGGDIEQDANLVLSLYTDAIDKLQEDTSGQKKQLPPVVEMKVSVLKNRGGTPGVFRKMDWTMPIYTIQKKEI